MQPISRSPYLGNIDLPLMKVTLRDFITEKCKHPGWSICMRPWFLGLGFTVFTVPTASHLCARSRGRGLPAAAKEEEGWERGKATHTDWE